MVTKLEFVGELFDVFIPCISCISIMYGFNLYFMKTVVRHILWPEKTSKSKIYYVTSFVLLISLYLKQSLFNLQALFNLACLLWSNTLLICVLMIG